MKPRQTLFKPKDDKNEKELKKLIKKIEKDDIELLKCEIPGKNDGTMRYMRQWKL